MPNPTNGVRGGPSKRSDQKKNPESSSFDSQDPSRRNIEEPRHSIDVLACSSEALQRLANLTHYFRSPSFARDMQMVEDEYGAEIAQENTIRKLNETVESLAHVKSEETEKLRRDNKRLMDEQEDCQQEKKKCLEIQKKLEDQYDLAEASRKKENEQILQDEKAKADKELKTKKAKLEDDHKKKSRELDERLSKLLAENVSLKQRYKEAQDKLEKKKAKHTRYEKSLEDENKKLTEELKQLQAQFPVEEQVIEYYIQHFRQIYDAIKAVSSRYFQKLPEQAENNPEAVHQELCELSPIFRATPIWPSPVSEFLRMRNVEQVISSSLCDSIWQPFLPQDSIPNNKTVSQILETISISLSASGGPSESVWRVLTLRGINAQYNSTPVSNQIESLVQRILKILQPLTLTANLGDLRKELSSIVSASATLWATARMDSAHISLTTQVTSAQFDKSNWLAVDMPSTSPPPSPSSPSSPISPISPISPTSTEAMVLFPLVLHKSPAGKGTTTVHQGVALFPTSRVCREGLLEKRKLEEELEREISDARKRRMSVSRGRQGGGKVEMV